MPIYNYHCNRCVSNEEAILPMSKRNDIRLCSCGSIMERVISLPQSAIIPVNNRDRIFNTLNKDNGFGFPDDKHTTRYGKVITDSLNREKPVIGRGF